MRLTYTVYIFILYIRYLPILNRPIRKAFALWFCLEILQMRVDSHGEPVARIISASSSSRINRWIIKVGLITAALVTQVIMSTEGSHRGRPSWETHVWSLGQQTTDFRVHLESA